jgi:hypothetical protein
LRRLLHPSVARQRPLSEQRVLERPPAAG